LHGFWIFNAEEALVYVMAHELRHLWQALHPKGYRVWGARGQMSERDTDAYGLRMLRAWRRGECPAEPVQQAALIAPEPVVSVQPSKTELTLERKREQAKRLERKIKSNSTRLKRVQRSIAALERSLEKQKSRGQAGEPGPETKTRCVRVEKEPESADPRTARLQFRGETFGEFEALILDLSVESRDEDRRAMAAFVAAHQKGRKVTITATPEAVPHMKVLAEELAHWSTHGTVPGLEASFERARAEVNRALDAAVRQAAR
jgi:hypothetical protein